MITARLLRCLGAAGAASALALATGLGPAAGASTPGWRVFRTVGAAAGVTYPQPTQGSASFVVTGKRNAWSVWSDQSGYIVLHWNGSAWTKVPASSLTALTSPVAVGSSSASDAWLFNGGTTKALHWNGAAWSTRTIPSWVITISRSGQYGAIVADFGHSDLWVFGSGSGDYAARYNGHTWTKSHLPVLADTSDISAVSRNDIWAVGLRSSGQRVLLHWNGKAWHTLALPKATAPKGGTEVVRDLMATAPSNVWLQQDVVPGGEGGERIQYLLHWNGKTWQRVHLHFPTSSAYYMARDGHGGIWLVGNGKAPAYTWYLYHLNAGHWTRRVLPSLKGVKQRDLFGIFHVPGSTSMWATGTLALPHEGNNGIVGGIWKYGA